MGLLQAMGEHQLLVGEQRDGGAFGHQLAFIENDHAGAEVHDQLQVVGGDDFGAGQGLQQGFEFAPATRVEVAGRFIQHEHRRFAGEHARQADAAFLAVAEPVRFALLKPRSPTRLRQWSTRARRLPPSRPSCRGPKATSSKTVAEMSWSSGSWKSRPTRWRTVSRVPAVSGSPSTQMLGWAGRLLRQQAVEVEQQGGFARAIGAEHGDAFILGDGKGELVERQPAARSSGRRGCAFRRRRSFPPPGAHGEINPFRAVGAADKKLADNGGEIVPGQRRRREKVRLARARCMRRDSSASTGR